MALSFARRSFNRILLTGAVGTFAKLVVRVFDGIIAGQMLGMDALAAVVVVAPVTAACYFVSKLAVSGSGFLFARSQGAFDGRRSAEIVGQALLTSLVLGLAIFAVLFLGRDFYLDLVGVSGNVRMEAVAYWRWQAVLMAVTPLTLFFWKFVPMDGEVPITIAANIIGAVCGVIFPVVFTWLFGTAGGASFGALVSALVMMSVLSLHFLRRTNGVRFRLHFSLSDLREMVCYALPDAMTWLSRSVFIAISNAMVVRCAGNDRLPVVSMVILVCEVADKFDRVGEAFVPVAGVYRCEGNGPRWRQMSRYAFAVSVVLGMLCLGILFAFAPEVVSFYGFDAHAGIAADAVHALRILALSLPFTSVICFCSVLHLTEDRVMASVMVSAFGRMLSPILFLTVFGLFVGYGMMWYGMTVGFVIASLVFPLRMVFLRETRDSDILNVSCILSNRTAVMLRDRAEAFFRARGVSDRTVTRVILAVEDYAARQTGCGGGRIRAEMSLFGDTPGVARVILRDTGPIFNAANVDAGGLTSLHDYTLAMLMTHASCRRSLCALGCNRTEIVFSDSAAPAKDELGGQS